MKTAVLSYSGVFCIFLLTCIFSVIIMKTSYSEQISNSLDSSIEYAVGMLQMDRKLVRNEDEYLATDKNIAISYDNLAEVKQDFITYLTDTIDSRITNLDIKFDSADDDDTLSVKVVANFVYPTGQTDKIIMYKTMILEKREK